MIRSKPTLKTSLLSTLKLVPSNSLNYKINAPPPFPASPSLTSTLPFHNLCLSPNLPIYCQLRHTEMHLCPPRHPLPPIPCVLHLGYHAQWLLCLSEALQWDAWSRWKVETSQPSMTCHRSHEGSWHQNMSLSWKEWESKEEGSSDKSGDSRGNLVLWNPIIVEGSVIMLLAKGRKAWVR